MADKNLLNEFAGFANDLFNVPLAGGVLRNLDEVLRAQGGGRGLRLYDDLERDAMVFAVLQKRKMAVIQRPWKVEPASTSLRDRKAAELVSSVLASLPFDRLCCDLLDALLKGYAVVEIMWRYDGATLLPDRIVPRDQRRFVFDADCKPRLLTRDALLAGMPLPERKFIVHSQGGNDGSPYGLGLGNRLFWPVLFKRQGIGFWLAFADRFGSPTAMGKHPADAQPEQVDKLLAALSNIAQDTSIAVPDNVVVELLEPKSGNGTVYEPLVRYMDEQISVVVLGETMTTQSGGAGLGSSQANVHNDVRTELAQADADLLSETLNATLIQWLVELNLPGAQAPRVVRDFNQVEDLKLRAERDKLIAEMSGYQPTLAYIHETYGGEWQAAGQTAQAGITAMPTAAASLRTALAGTAGGAAAAPDEELTAQLAQAATEPLQTMLDRVNQLVQDARDLAQLQADLLAAYGGLDTEQLVKLMAAAFALAELKGMAAVQDGQ